MKIKSLITLAAAALFMPGIICADTDKPAKRVSPSLVQIKDAPGLPRVLLIGDSISQGYTIEVRRLLNGKANVHRPPTNCGSTSSGIANIDKWLATGGSDKWDVIHFNWGLHDIKYLKSGRQNVPPANYEKNLETLVRKMKAKAKTLIFATTTPIPEKQRHADPRKQEDVAAYNEIARRVMKANGVRINDLNAAITPDLAKYAIKEDVHFTSAGGRVLAQFVAEAIENALPPSSSVTTTAATGKPRVTEIEPRVWRCDFESAALGGRAMRFMIVLPEGVKRDARQRAPVIYFLHGRGRHDRTLLEDATCRARLFASPRAIVLPYAREGWYVNSPVQPGERYSDYIDEVITLSAQLFPVGNTRATRAIGGWSMGGYGAMLTACRRAGLGSGEQGFAAVATIIGLLDFPTPKEVGRYAVPERFGTDAAEWAHRNPLLLIDSLAAARTPLHIAYATRAPERGMNERFIVAAQAAGLSPEVVRIDGGHTFPVVQEALPGVFAFLEKALVP